MPEDERYEGDDLEVLARAEEAEEAAFGEEEVGVCCSVRTSSPCDCQEAAAMAACRL